MSGAITDADKAGPMTPAVREWYRARLSGLGVELNDEGLRALVTDGEGLLRHGPFRRDLSSGTLAEEQHAREAGTP